MERDQESGRISRRDVLKWFAAAAAASQLESIPLWAQNEDTSAMGYGKDPNLMKMYKPGEVWPLTLSGKQRDIVSVLADSILPEDKWGPAASTLNVPEFIDEWVSAPYSRQQSSRKKILPGLDTMNTLGQNKFGKELTALTPTQMTTLIDSAASAKGENSLLGKAESFLYEFTSLCMGAYYGTPDGWKAIGYVGNTPLASFDGPPPEVLDRLGLEQTVKEQ
ncbi:gluconate 2-dehydrogenase subunit 3 family protein [Opitutaceae bacterium]|nr:gluconate 2-dehydrogenase subunit 3 family protein [Opitutaceae bacterium]